MLMFLQETHLSAFVDLLSSDSDLLIQPLLSPSCSVFGFAPAVWDNWCSGDTCGGRGTRITSACFYGTAVASDGESGESSSWLGMQDWPRCWRRLRQCGSCSVTHSSHHGDCTNLFMLHWCYTSRSSTLHHQRAEATSPPEGLLFHKTAASLVASFSWGLESFGFIFCE